MKHSVQDRGTLLLALIAGLSINGTFAALFSSIVPFSIFPILSLVLTVYCLHQRYQNRRFAGARRCLFYSRGAGLQYRRARGISGHRL